MFAKVIYNNKLEKKKQSIKYITKRFIPHKLRIYDSQIRIFF